MYTSISKCRDKRLKEKRKKERFDKNPNDSNCTIFFRNKSEFSDFRHVFVIFKNPYYPYLTFLNLNVISKIQRKLKLVMSSDMNRARMSHDF